MPKKTASRKKKKRRRKSEKKARDPRRALRYAAALLALLFAAGLWVSLAARSYGQWALRSLEQTPQVVPVEVLARPRLLSVGASLLPHEIEHDFKALGYKKVRGDVIEPGEYRLESAQIEFYQRAWHDGMRKHPAAYLHVEWRDGRIVEMVDSASRPVRRFLCEPVVLGVLQGDLHADRRPKQIDDFPQRLIQAVLAAEDARYFRHRGVDFKAVVRAAWFDLKGSGPLQGGSTITQQVIKNRILGSQRTFWRKAREAFLAWWIEGSLSKKEILELYLNEVYLGQRGPVSIIGFPAAARHYFGKDLADLRLVEEVQLASMIASPGRFEPRSQPERARRRRAWLLARMAELEMISEPEAEAASHASIHLAPPPSGGGPHGDLIDAARAEAAARGWTPAPSGDPMRIHTTIDAGLQAAARASLDETLSRLEAEDAARGRLEGAVVALDVERGEVLALIGDRQGLAGRFNHALNAHRQPGSAFKPFVALAAFAGHRAQPSDRLEDAPLTIRQAGRTWRPRNYDGKYRGEVTIRRALSESLNVPFVRLAQSLEPGELAAWVRRIDLGDVRQDLPSLVLGTAETSPWNLARGYLTLASLGVSYSPSIVERIGSPDPAIEAPTLEPVEPARRIVPRGPAYMVLDVLADVVTEGTGRRLASRIAGHRVAGKTGTTQDGRDAWFTLISGSTVVVVWVGRDDAKPAGLTGANAALPVVAGIIDRVGDRILADLPGPPSDVSLVEIDVETGGVAVRRCENVRTEVFHNAAVPTPCQRHVRGLRGIWERIRGGGGRGGSGDRR